MITAHDLLATIQLIANDLPGRMGVAIKYLPAGPVIRYHASDVFPSASVIKIAVLAEVFRQAYADQLDLHARMTLDETSRVEGSGVLCHLSDGVTLSIKDAATLMIIVSDNVATNMLIDLVGVPQINALISHCGLSQTVLHRRVDFTQPGSFAHTSPDDMLHLMELLQRGELVCADASTAMMAILHDCEADSMIPRFLPINPYFEELGQAVPSAVVAHKTGGIAGVRNDVGVVTLRNEHGCCRYIVSAFTADVVDEALWTPENIAVRAVADVSRCAYQAALDGLGTWQ